MASAAHLGDIRDSTINEVFGVGGESEAVSRGKDK